MADYVDGDAGASRVTGHVQVRGVGGQRKYLALWIGRDGGKRTKTLGPAHVRDSGRRTPRGAVIWRAGHGPCPPGALTPKAAEDALASILEAARNAPLSVEPPAPTGDRVPTFGDATDQWLTYLRVEKQRKRSTLQDARNVVRSVLIAHFGRDRPLVRVEHHHVRRVVDGRERLELREERVDAITTADVDALRRELLESGRSPRTVQKIMVLLHGIFKLAKRRGLMARNPSEDAERVTLLDDTRFNVLEPKEFEAVYAAVVGELDERDDDEPESDVLDELTTAERRMYADLLGTAFYAGLRMGELLDLPRRAVDFADAMIRVETGYTHGERSTTKGHRARSTPMVPLLAKRLRAHTERATFLGEADYVFCNEVGERVDDARVRSVFYAGLHRAGFGHRRAKVDAKGNPQKPMVVHDLRHSWCTWAVNVWELSRVKEYAGHRDIKTTMRYIHHQTKAADAELGGAYLDRVLSADPVPA
jgi:integrase